MRWIRIAAALAWLYSHPALAVPNYLAVTFTGVVETLTPGLDQGPFMPGDEVTGMFIVDRDVPDTLPADLQQGFYPSAVLHFEFTIGSYVGSSGPIGDENNLVYVGDEIFVPAHD